MGPKKGNIIAKNQIGITTGNLASALKHKLFVSCTPTTFSHTKYSGVHANPNVINCPCQNYTHVTKNCTFFILLNYLNTLNVQRILFVLLLALLY